MTHSARGWLLTVALGFVCQALSLRAAAQEPARPEYLPSSVVVQEQYSAYALPPSGWPVYDFSQPDPLLDRPYSAQPSLFANVETNVLWLHLRNQLGGFVQNGFTGQGERVKFAGNPLDPTASPRFEVGYRFPDNWGSLSFGYRFLVSQGHDQLMTDSNDVVQAPANQDGRLVYNQMDFTYNSREYSLDPNWNMRWGVGVRTMFLYFDSRLQFIDPGTDPGTILAQSESNYIQCYGAWAYLDLERRIGDSGFAVFGRLEGTDTYARTYQNYTETVAGAGPGGGPETFLNRYTGGVMVSIAREVLGVSYVVPEWNYSRFMLGYQYETYFQIGRQSPFNGFIDTRGQLDAHGLFLRAEINF
jgi:hypothetical protein